METSLVSQNIPADKQKNATAPTFAGPTRGKQTALVCGRAVSLNEVIAQKLIGAGYQPVCHTETEEGLEALKFHLFELCVLTDNFASPAPADHPLLLYLAKLPMSTRRRIFVVLVNPSYRTNDKLAAFCLSVNLIVNPEDVERFDSILKEAREEHDRLYHLFREVSIKVGKA